MSKAYLIVDAVIHDREKFGAYASRNAALVAKMGGRYLVVGGGDVTALEGESFKGRAVISEWPSRAAALAYWHSAEYAEVRKLREGICEAKVTLVDGLPETRE
jgi:uncharacterized protein (DUF1330 family)